MVCGRRQAEVLHPVIVSVPEARIGLAGRDKVEFLSKFARKAVLRSAELSGLALEEFPKDQAGTPLACRGTYWSLSHKPEKVAGVVATFPVGIDLEKIRPVHAGLFRRLASPQEWQLVGAKELTSLFMLWTAKEAVLKATGRGLAGLDHCRLVAMTGQANLIMEYQGRRWLVIQRRVATDFIAALATTGQAVRWHIED